MFGKFLINLESTVFDFKSVASMLEMKNFFIKGKLQKAVAFGSVFVIDNDVVDSLTSEQKSFIANMHGCNENQVSTSPHFIAPSSWRMPQLLKALGAFSSSTAAMKNGWNLDIPEGLSEHFVQINNTKGVVIVHKITSSNSLNDEIISDRQKDKTTIQFT